MTASDLCPRVPRARGDEPHALRSRGQHELCVPRARGDEPRGPCRAGCWVGLLRESAFGGTREHA